jgi:hypothetical protein
MPRSIVERHSSPDTIFQLEFDTTDAGSVRLRFKPRRPLKSFYGNERDLASLIYSLAAELERRSKIIGARWAISPIPYNAHLDIEVAGYETDEAREFLMGTLVDLGLNVLIGK